MLRYEPLHFALLVFDIQNWIGDIFWSPSKGFTYAGSSFEYETWNLLSKTYH